MKGNRRAVPDTQTAQAAASPPILPRAEANRRMLLLADLQAALAAHEIRSVLARNHRLVLRSEPVPCEPSSPTDPQLHIFAHDGTDIATTDGTTYSLASGTKYPAGDPAATAALMQRGRLSARRQRNPAGPPRDQAHGRPRSHPHLRRHRDHANPHRRPRPHRHRRLRLTCASSLGGWLRLRCLIVDYAEAVAAFFVPHPEGTPLPAAVSGGGPARRLRDACEPVAMHAVWSRTTNERLARLGLDFLTSYVGGRGACLGEPTGAVVAAAFAWFEPGLVTALWDAARSAVALDRLVRARDESTVASLREILAGEDPGEVANLLADAAEPADGMGRPLFSGRRADGRPEDPVHLLWWACGLVREHRGDSHVAAAAAAGLSALEMNILTELWIGMPLLSYTATRGWPPEAMQRAVARLESRGWVRGGGLTDQGRAGRLGVEQRTDDQEQAIATALGGRLDEVCGRLDHWGQMCIAAGAFPPDILKRAAG